MTSRGLGGSQGTEMGLIVSSWGFFKALGGVIDASRGHIAYYFSFNLFNLVLF